jgi:hypothetical protein
MGAEAVTRDEMHGFAVPPKRRRMNAALGGLKSYDVFGKTANERRMLRCK